MMLERNVKLMRKGKEQIVCIPAELEFASDEVTIRREGNRLIIEPVPASSLLDVLARLDPIDEEIGEIDDLPMEPVEI